MRLLSLLPALLGVAVLGGCGGSDGPDDSLRTQTSATEMKRPLSLTPPAPPASAPDEPSVDLIFDWAERQYPDLFPPGALTQTIDHENKRYTARFYEVTGNYLGVVGGGTVFGLGPFTSGVLKDFGAAEAYLCQASPEQCGKPPAQVVRVRVSAGSLQCTPGSGRSLLEWRRRLTDAGVKVLGSGCDFARVGVLAVCGVSDARYWLFDIDAADAAKATEQGLLPLDEQHPGTPNALACGY